MSGAQSKCHTAMFNRLVHADWSCRPDKRWVATAERITEGWVIDTATPAPSPEELLTNLLGSQKVLAGFDFPIGLPVRYGERTQLGSFQAALLTFGAGDWADFYSVAETVDQVSLKRPFYPYHSRGGHRRAQLRHALKCEKDGELLRECEKPTSERRAACCLFWTLGANQVGKAALHGWRNLIRPAVERGASLWPFDGPLKQLSQSAHSVICETYPREAYSHVGVSFPPRASKRNQGDRRAALGKGSWWSQRDIIFTDEASAQLDDAFGTSPSAEDAFDAMLGLLSMIEVVEGRRQEGKPSIDEKCSWEGWILGQRMTTSEHLL